MANRSYDIEEAGEGEILLAYEEAIGFMCGTQVIFPMTFFISSNLC